MISMRELTKLLFYSINHITFFKKYFINLKRRTCMSTKKCVCCGEDVAIGKNTIGDEDNHFWHVSCIIKKPVNLETFQETDLSKLIPANVDKLNQSYITSKSFLTFFFRKVAILAKNLDIVFDEKMAQALGVNIEENSSKKLLLNQATMCFITMCQRLEYDPIKLLEILCSTNYIKQCLNINYSAQYNGIKLNIEEKYNLSNFMQSHNRDLRAGYIYSLQ